MPAMLKVSLRFGVGVLVAGAFFIATSSQSQAAPATKEQVLSWFEKQQAAAKDIKTLAGKMIRYRMIVGGRPNEAEVEELRRTVAGKPDHPARKKLAILERRLKNGPDVSEVSAVRNDELHFRVSTNALYDKTWTEMAADGGIAWTTTDGGQLMLRDKESGEDYASAFNAYHSSAAIAIGNLVFGGVWEDTDWPEKIENVSVDGTRWSLRIVRTSPDNSIFFIDFNGTWNESTSTGTVKEKKLLSDGKPPVLEIKTTLEGWKFDSVLGRDVASRVVIENRDPDFGAKTLEWIGAEEIDAKKFNAIVAVPKLNTPDPLRGSLNLKSIYDVRPSKSQVQRVLPDGTAEKVRDLPGKAENSDGMLRTLGWVVLASSIVILVAVRLSRRKP